MSVSCIELPVCLGPAGATANKDYFLDAFNSEVRRCAVKNIPSFSRVWGVRWPQRPGYLSLRFGSFQGGLESESDKVCANVEEVNKTRQNPPACSRESHTNRSSSQCSHQKHTMCCHWLCMGSTAPSIIHHHKQAYGGQEGYF